MFYVWRRMQEEDRRRVWLLYGWFSGLMLCGSCFGVVTWAAYMMFFANVLNSQDELSRRNLAQGMAMAAVANSWRAVFTVTYAIEFLCLSAAKLMVLDRMRDFAAPRGDGMRRLWVVGGRVVMAVVVLGNAVGLAANVAAAVRFDRAAAAASASSSFIATNNIQDGAKYQRIAQEEIQLAGPILSVQSFCEVAVLLLIVAAFVAAGVLCARRMRSVLLSVDAASAAAAAGRTLQLQIVGTAAFVFVTFLVRSVYSTMFAVATQLQELSKRCPGVTSPCDPTCYNVYTHMQQWMFNTPEFQLTIVLISSPLTLLVALWGMTSSVILQLMKSSRQKSALLQRSLVSRRT
jgi:hypothetical protein